ncbi:MAG: ABC transporter permease [Myxococcales bacterium]|nr:ABC transporter permease [Myxococcales bacterium]
MRFTETVRIALHALGANRVRTALTMLGVIIGVGAVVAMLGLGEGARDAIERNIGSLGSDLLIVRPGADTRGPVRSGTVDTLTREDAEALTSLPGVLRVAPLAGGAAQAKFLAANVSASIVGTTPAFLRLRNITVAEGQPFNDTEAQSRRRVALLGANVADELFGGLDPVDERIQIRGITFHVLGVLTAKGESLGSPDDQIFIPVTTAQSVLFGQNYLDSIYVQATNRDVLKGLEKDMERTLRVRHRIRPGDEDDFHIRSLQDMVQAVNQVTSTLTALLGGVAAVSLIVGGIGIMNIMLVSVRERTREIGVRMAVGARRRDILLQFLIEAMVVSLIGGVIGLALGAGSAALLAHLGGFDFVVPLYAVVLAFVTSLTIGVVFGVWPARNAARLDPVDALRFE